MRLTTHTDYALRLLIYLTLHADRLVTIEEVAKQYGISRNHLMKVAHRLGTLGYLVPVRGRGGGLRLKGDPKRLRLGRLVARTEGLFPLAECFEPDGHCKIEAACRLKGVFEEAKDAFLATLDRYTLADLAPNAPMLIRLLDAPVGRRA